MIGNVLEWYDFAIYGYFAAQIGRSFFPHEDAIAQLLAAFGVFAIGYLMRPIGGAIVGHIGDSFGRRAALTFSVTAMAIPTFLMGLLPGYRSIGLLAAIGLTVLRIVRRGFPWAANIPIRWCSRSSMRRWALHGCIGWGQRHGRHPARLRFGAAFAEARS